MVKFLAVDSPSVHSWLGGEGIVGMSTGCRIMVLEEALASPEIGNIIPCFLYADELVFAFNLSWELSEYFLRDIAIFAGACGRGRVGRANSTSVASGRWR